MDGAFWLIGLLAAGVALVTPIAAFVALRRTNRLGERIDWETENSRESISELRRQVAELRRELTEVSRLAAQLSGKMQAETPAPASEEPQIPLAPRVSQPETPAVATPEPVSAEAAATAPEESPVISAMPAFVAAAMEPAPATASPVEVHDRPVTAAVPRQVPDYSPAFLNAAPPAGQTTFPSTPPRRSFAERLRATLPLEEVLGMNVFAKIGIVLLVLGFALLGRVALVAMGPAGKVALLCVASAAMLGGGIWLERRERYRLVGRAGIGGGWALLFFTVFAMWHVPAMRVMNGLTLNCILLLIVAAAMVAHTLRYRSQVVTGLAFLLAFATVALGQDTVYALSAGVILAGAIVAICLQMSWYELEIFGILATFANHFYWLWKLYPDGVEGHAFPQFWASSIILVLYWLSFRVSYVVRRIRSPRDERLSTIAALLNTTLLLAVMRFQSTRPELSFYALLVLGAAEFFFGQLPATRRRRSAFIVLTILGSLLMLASVPFRFSGNNIALLWIIAAEALLIAGIVQAEVVFRRIALVTGVGTGALVLWKAVPILQLRAASEAPLVHSGILLLACAVLFWANAHRIARRWKPLFGGLDGYLATAQSYLGCLAAFIGTWALFTSDWTAFGWAALMVATAWASRRLESRHLLLQTWFFGAAVIVRAALINCHFDHVYPQHLALRVLTLPLLAILFYAGAATVGSQEMRRYIRALMLWCGSALVIALVWTEVDPAWVAVLWMAFAVLLALVGRKLHLPDLCFQEHVVALLVGLQLLFVNLTLAGSLTRYVPVILYAAGLYAVSRLCTPPEADYRRVAAWAHTSLATALLAALAWNQAAQPWLAVVWAAFALALALIDRRFDIEELPWQVHALALCAVARAAAINFSVAGRWHGVDLRLLTIGFVVLALYVLAWLIHLPEDWRRRNYHHAYTWTASFLAAWLLWYELQPVAVAVGFAGMGLLLFEWGMIRGVRPLRLQAYAALTASFARIFFVNLTASRVPGDIVSPAVFTVLPIAAICFYVWWRLLPVENETGRWPIHNTIAWFGTVAIAALLYFQAVPIWVVCWWSGLALILLAAALWLRQEVFLHQAVALAAGAFARGILHNVFGGSYFMQSGWRGSFGVLVLGCALLLAGLPLAFRLRSRLVQEPMQSRLARRLGVHRPEQWFFFAPALLLVFLIAIKMNPGMVTLSWGMEGALMILLGLAVGERSYRLTGLLLLLVCVGKIVCLDAWHLHERDRYITFIVLGAALTMVSMLYNRYREALRRLL